MNWHLSPYYPQDLSPEGIHTLTSTPWTFTGPYVPYGLVGAPSVGAVEDDVKKKYAGLLKSETLQHDIAYALDQGSQPAIAAMTPAVRYAQAVTHWNLAASIAESIAALAAQYGSLQLEAGIPAESVAKQRALRYHASAAADAQLALGGPAVQAPPPIRPPAPSDETANAFGAVGLTALILGVGYLGWLLLARRPA